jgi:MFS family permease
MRVSAVYILPLYTQHVLGYSPIGSGALLLPLVLTQTITSTLAGLIAQITGRSWPCVLGGFILLTISQGIQIMFDNHTRVAVVIGITFMQGFAIGFMIQSECPP